MTPRIGQWYCYCCIEDLYQIDQERLEMINDWMEEGIMMPRIWDTHEEALAELQKEEAHA